MMGGMRLIKFFRCEAGPTATEYAVALAFMIMVAIVAVKAFGTSVNNEFTNAAAKMPKPKSAAP